MTDARHELKTLLGTDDVDIEKVCHTLNGFDSQTRIDAIRCLGKKAQVRLWNAAEGHATALSDVVPTDVEARIEIIHSGKNSLPIFTKFEKRFCRVASDDSILYGYNEGPTRKFVGPGYFVTSFDSERGEVGINYYTTPPVDAVLPEEWPALRSNERGLSRFVYAKMIDYLRKVSDHVTIGRAVRKGKTTNNYFLLCRNPATKP
jgi:hypothetical protein